MMKKNIQRYMFVALAAMAITPFASPARKPFTVSNVGENIAVKRIETLLNNPGKADAKWQSKVEAQLADLRTFGDPAIVRNLTNRYNVIIGKESVIETSDISDIKETYVAKHDTTKKGYTKKGKKKYGKKHVRKRGKKHARKKAKKGKAGADLEPQSYSTGLIPETIIEDKLDAPSKTAIIDEKASKVQSVVKQSEECGICEDKYTEDTAVGVLPCKHYFHLQCITDWLTEEDPSCPICEVKATVDDIVEIEAVVD